MYIQNKILKLIQYFIYSSCMVAGLFIASANAQSQGAGSQDKALLKAGDDAFKAKNYTLAQQKYEASALLGNSEAMRNLGENFYYGLGVEKNHTRAKQWFEEAAKRGDARAMGFIGLIYSEGEGINRDQKLALQWLEEAAKRGDAFGMMRLGWAYNNGLGIGQNYEIAMRWYQEAAKRGNSNAMLNIGLMFEKGNGVKQDYCIANSWHRKSIAADGENDAALYNLGGNLWRGKCGEPDKQQARKLLNLAESRGYSYARRELAAMEDSDRPRSGSTTARNNSGDDDISHLVSRQREQAQAQADSDRQQAAANRQTESLRNPNSLGW